MAYTFRNVLAFFEIVTTVLAKVHICCTKFNMCVDNTVGFPAWCLRPAARRGQDLSEPDVPVLPARPLMQPKVTNTLSSSCSLPQALSGIRNFSPLPTLKCSSSTPPALT